MELLFLSVFLFAAGSVASEISIRFVFIIEVQDRDLSGGIQRALKEVEVSSPGVTLDGDIVLLDREHEDTSYSMLCSAISKGVTAIIDLSWSPWQLAQGTGASVVYSTLHAQQALTALAQYLAHRNATDAALIVPTEKDVDRTLYRLLGASDTRLWAHAGLTRDAARALRDMRPEPEFYALVGGTQFVMDTYARAVKEKLVRRAHRWTLVFTDYPDSNLDLSSLVLPTAVLRLECCRLSGGDECLCPSDAQRPQVVLTALIRQLTSTASKLDPPIEGNASCEKEGVNLTISRVLETSLGQILVGNETTLRWDSPTSTLELRSCFLLSSWSPDEGVVDAARWCGGQQFHLLPAATLPPLRMFFRIGTSAAVPWSMPKLDPESGVQLVTEDGQPEYEGYCIDLIHTLAETMGFDYEIVTPRSGGFGNKLANGTWDGVVGDLMRGETDMAIGALTMTAEREEVIDFVPPYFEQTGILIVIRKPTRKTSLFKFMTVLRTEVWLSIVGALVCTAFMIWLLDKHSPYSARNNPAAYPYPCREFTLKESFWFALTSFTPQGGGEAPKALSGRTLVAAYWLFVVLMLATFTANLAAFLTVERMQTPVSSLEQLARQSRINYTVVEGSTVHQYFINMKFAEDTLYRVWKEITLNATSDQAQYRVWDYPIREQYGHILLAINASGPVLDAKTGFEQVNEHTDADFAFIHDSAEIRYEITRNCNLTEVGEVFAEQPYAIAVQQGSRLQEELSRALLELQKERYLEQLAAKSVIHYIAVQQGSRLQEELSRALLELQKERYLEQLAAKSVIHYIAVQQGSRLQEELSRALLELQKERYLEQLAAKSVIHYIAVQQGSRLQEELSRALLELQKERYLEQLAAKSVIHYIAVQQGSRLQEELSRALLELQKERYLEQLAAKSVIHYIAVQQGSRLQEELSRALLELQKERYLEQLAAKYWNETARQSCPDADESEGITLESLGGVFIATLFGLGVAMLTLAWEVFYYKRKEKTKVEALSNSGEKPLACGDTKKGLGKITENISRLRKREKRGQAKQVTIGTSFKPAAEKGGVSYISVYPKNEYRP